MTRPTADEAASYYYKYIDLVRSDDVVPYLGGQFKEMMPLLESIKEEDSTYRYAPEKWSIRQVLNHINDCERVFLGRALWFARGFKDALPSFDQEIAAAGAEADGTPW